MTNQGPPRCSISDCSDDYDEKLRLLEMKVHSLQVLYEKATFISPNDAKNIGNETDEDEGKVKVPSEKETLRVSFSDVEDNIPRKVSTPSDTTSTTGTVEEEDELAYRPRGGLYRYPSARPSLISQQSVINEEVHDEDYFKELNEDTFTLMILSEPLTKQWFFGFIVFGLQISLLLMILIEQYGNSKGSTPFDVPYEVDPFVQVGQLLAIIVSLATQTDLVTAIITFMMLWTERRAFWTSLIKVPENSSLWIWVKRIAFPIACEFIGGLLVLLATFVIVVTSDSVIDLFKDFAAMQVISQLDDMMFWLALHGYIGSDMAHGAKQARKIRIHDKDINTVCGIPLRTIILMFIFLVMGGGWGYIVQGQLSGDFFEMKYPHCYIPPDSHYSYIDMGNKKCDGVLNTIECGFDDGDCITYNLGHPNCQARDPDKVGDGVCHMEYNSKKCNFDGGDCCPVLGSDFRDGMFYGDGICNGGIFNSKNCKFDGGDCDDLNQKYPTCGVLDPRNDYHEGIDFFDNELSGLGDGKCNGGAFNTEQCGYDAGDCIKCNQAVPDSSKIGDGVCDGGIYMDHPDCNLDGGDCKKYVDSYPYCNVTQPAKIGDGFCDGGAYNNYNCEWDGLDCFHCHVSHPLLIGDGWCDGGDYMSEECDYDGGDCVDCIGDPSMIGDGECDLSHNTTECSWDGGDCLEGGRPLICDVINPKVLGDGYCDGGAYNTEECGFDGGDCIKFNKAYPDCKAETPWEMGDGVCDYSANTIECAFDDGDCLHFNEDYPDCDVAFPSLIGDGECDGDEYNVEECGYDGGDCDVFHGFEEAFPNCGVESWWQVGNGVCNGGEYNTAECEYDGGDCDTFNDVFPDCEVEFPSRLGDGVCDGDEYNTAECGYDGLDCQNGNFTICDDGDCDEFYDNFDSCTVDNPMHMANGVCNGGDFNTEDCGFDDGDCDYFNKAYPNCTVKFPSYVGNGICDGEEYNTTECGFDGFDCVDSQIAMAGIAVIHNFHGP